MELTKTCLDGASGASDNWQNLAKVPSDLHANYSPEMIARRRAWVEEVTGVAMVHSNHFSVAPEATAGNIENFSGVAQVPLGLAGPLRVNGEHAIGGFIIPMCTTEGTLVASYNRGIKLLNSAGGAQCTVVEDRMQRAPLFVLDSARDGRDFILWIEEHLEEIRQLAESTSEFARLLAIEKFAHNKFVHLRFSYSTGDAAGQNMVTVATFAACNWILANNRSVRHFELEANLATDKKSSFVNSLLTRGKRVTAEAVIPRQLMIEQMRASPEIFVYNQRLSALGAYVAGSNNNGGHSANGVTAMFIATGQDVANVAESSACVVYSEVTPQGDLYGSCTIPSLIVGSYGGGTALPTQRECLEMMDCYGDGKARKLAEIVAAVVLAGELSICSAFCSTASAEFVLSHERFGRNR